MEYEISFSTREMPPFKRPRSFEHKTFVSGSREILKDNQSPINIPKIIEDSTEKAQKAVESSKPLQECNATPSLPNGPSQFSSALTELELTDKSFTELPDFFKSIVTLKKLSIHDASLTALPDSIGELKNLRDLNLSHNYLQELPETISNLKHLEKLNLSHNQLQSLPSLFAKLQLLKDLDLSYNKFKRLPKSIENGMGTLRLLDVSENPHMRLNVIPGSKYLEKFVAKNNLNCSKFPDWILCSKFFNMKEVNLDNTQFDFYSFNGKEGHLYYRKLSMNSSNLSSSYLDMVMEHMIALQVVNMGNDNMTKSETRNIFNYLPVQSFKNPKLITELNFRGTGLPAIPSTINILCNLKKLDLGMNNISWLPDEFCELQNLEYLKVDGNHMVLFPANIGNLTCLQEIHAQNNSLQTLPESIQNLKNLRMIDLFDNQFKELPEVLGKLVILKGLDLELNYFATTDVKIGNAAYSELREYFMKEICINSRTLGVKQEILDDEDDDENYSQDWFLYASGEEDDDDQCIVSLDCTEENWDNVTDSDDEYEPKIEEIDYNERSKGYFQPQDAPLGFCPADMHPVPVKKEVAYMRAYGSVTSYEVVEGQFDDA